MKKSIKYQIIFAIISLAVGGLAAIFIRNYTDMYNMLNKPVLSPPQIVFPIVWTILYILMGVGVGLVISAPRNANNKSDAIVNYAIQLLANFLWSIWFFNLSQYKLSFVWIILLLILVIFMTKSFYKISKPASLIQIPYIIWLVFAAYLNLFIALKN
ncbi:MAG: tryptophan-rich sensory protein [Clostridiales bacterium]|nr:tryptophan-rich sensory protein [Clostridiales bacterium]